MIVSIAGNQTTNKNIKELRKKQKKANKKSSRKIDEVADVLENFSMNMGGVEDYDFKTDFN